VSILIVDSLEVIQIHHRQGARLHAAPYQFPLLAEACQQRCAAPRPRQRIKVKERIREFTLDGREFQTQTFHRGHEAFEVPDLDRVATRGRPQESRRMLMHPLMLKSDLCDAGMVFKLAYPILLVPLAKPAHAMRVVADIPLIRRQITVPKFISAHRSWF
jgi:hypothetical protein